MNPCGSRGKILAFFEMLKFGSFQKTKSNWNRVNRIKEINCYTIVIVQSTVIKKKKEEMEEHMTHHAGNINQSGKKIPSVISRRDCVICYHITQKPVKD